MPLRSALFAGRVARIQSRLIPSVSTAHETLLTRCSQRRAQHVVCQMGCAHPTCGVQPDVPEYRISFTRLAHCNTCITHMTAPIRPISLQAPDRGQRRADGTAVRCWLHASHGWWYTADMSAASCSPPPGRWQLLQGRCLWRSGSQAHPPGCHTPCSTALQITMLEAAFTACGMLRRLSVRM